MKGDGLLMPFNGLERMPLTRRARCVEVFREMDHRHENSVSRMTASIQNIPV